MSMTGSPGYLDIAGLSAAIGPLGRKGRGSGKISICLLAETLIATCSVILVIRLLALGSVHEVQWFLGPVVLVVAAMVPAVAGRSSFPRIAPGTGQLRGVVVEFCRVCLAVLPVSFAVLWLLYWWGLGAPLGGAVPHGRGWLAFVLYQFMYVALAEEIFFRGYLLTNILRLVGPLASSVVLAGWVSIAASAACFAAAHVVVWGEPLSALTFFPGLVLGWLYLRTGCLLGPILFHGLANICYCTLAAGLT